MTWPIVSKEIGNDLPELYQKINATTRTIRNFLVENGVKANEINVNAPVVIDLNVQYLLKNDKNVLAILKTGDFRSQECIELLKEADIVVTNPPFSLFRERQWQ